LIAIDQDPLGAPALIVRDELPRQAVAPRRKPGKLRRELG